MVDSDARKKYAILSVSSVILVAMVVAVTIGTQRGSTETHEDVASSQKAVQGICAPTDYKDACVKSLKNSNSTDPKELVVDAFKATIDHIREAAENSTVLHELEADPRAKIALENCKELAQRATDDMERSQIKFQEFDLQNIDEILNDIQIWLSGAITYQETCLNGFDNTTGEAGEKMKKALNTSMQLTSNGLAMINDVSAILTGTDSTPAAGARRLLATDELPGWVDSRKRFLLQAAPKSIRADLVVSKDGSSKFKTINEAIKAIPENRNKTFVLYIKEGVYEEKVEFPKNQAHLVVIGDGPTKTRITGKLNFIDGTPTYHSATVAVLANFFIAKDIGFENSAGPEKHQAVALRVSADKSIFYNCHMDGYQDTLYAHTYRQFYRNCRITGTIDFIFGDSAAVFQNCTLMVRKPMDNQQCIVTAQGRKDIRQPTGLVMQNCSFVADPEYFPERNRLKSYLGRPWKEYSRTIIVESFIDDLIQPDGWLPWMGEFGLKTLFYSEFNNRGPGSGKNQRIKWPGIKELQSNRVERFLAGKFLEGDTWIPPTGLPYRNGFIFPPPKEDPNIKYSPVEPEETKDMGKPVNKEDYKMAAAPPPGSKPEIISDPGANPENISDTGSVNGSNTNLSPKPSPKPDFRSEADLGFSFGNDYNYDSNDTDSMSPAGSPEPSFPGDGSPELSLANVVAAPEPSSAVAGSPEASVADASVAPEPSSAVPGSPEASVADGVVAPESSPLASSGLPLPADAPSMQSGSGSAPNGPSSAPSPSGTGSEPAADDQQASTNIESPKSSTSAPEPSDSGLEPVADGAPPSDTPESDLTPKTPNSTPAPSGSESKPADDVSPASDQPGSDSTPKSMNSAPTPSSSDLESTADSPPTPSSPRLAPKADDQPASDNPKSELAPNSPSSASASGGPISEPTADSQTTAPASSSPESAPAADSQTTAPSSSSPESAPAADSQTTAPTSSSPESAPAADSSLASDNLGSESKSSAPASSGPVLAPAADDLA